MKKRILFLLFLGFLLVFAGCSNEYAVLVSYNNENGTVTINDQPISDEDYLYSGKVVIKATANDGYKFTGFYDLSTNALLSESEEFVIDNLSKNYSIKAEFSNKQLDGKCTITVLSQAGVICMQLNHEIGNSLPALTPVIKNGYKFTGWQVNGTPIDDNYKVTEDITVSPIVEAKRYNLSYSLDGGTNNSNNPTSYTLDDNLVLEEPTKSGYEFLGWYFDNQFQKLFDGFTSDNCGDVILYAKFGNSRNCTVNYYNMDGTLYQTFTVEKGQALPTVPDPQLKGYVFESWNITSNTVNGDTNVYPKFTYISYTINYVLNDGTVDADNPTSYKANDVIYLNSAKKEWYNFNGWSYDQNGKNMVGSRLDVSKCEDLTLYAIFTEMPIELNLKLVGSTLSWNVVPRADQYKVYLNEDKTAVAVTSDLSVDLSDYISSVGTYDVHVEAYGSNTLIISTKIMYTYRDSNYSGTYYDSIDLANLLSTQLKSELRTLMNKTHTKTTSYDDCKNYAYLTDGDPNNSSNVILFYTGLSIPANTSNSRWNREHVWPQSKGWFKTSGAGSDLHHIRPTDNTVNSCRSSLPYGYVTGGKEAITLAANGSQKSGCFYGSGYFEPRDEVKGDCARILFYLLVMYSQADSYSVTSVAKSMDLLLEWNKLDPVDDKEIRRNDAVQKIQGNRNPFIDYENLADKIWG